MPPKTTAMQTAKQLIDGEAYGNGTGMQDEVKNKFTSHALAVDAESLQQGIAKAIMAEHFAVLDGVRNVLLTVLDSFDGDLLKQQAITYALTLLSAMFSDFVWDSRTKTQQGVASGAATSMTTLDTSEDVRQARLKTLQQIANLVTLHEHNNQDKMDVAHGQAEAYYKGHMHAAKILRGMLDSMIIDANGPSGLLLNSLNGAIQQATGIGNVAASSAPQTGASPSFNITAPK